MFSKDNDNDDDDDDEGDRLNARPFDERHWCVARLRERRPAKIVPPPGEHDDSKPCAGVCHLPVHRHCCFCRRRRRRRRRCCLGCHDWLVDGCGKKKRRRRRNVMMIQWWLARAQ